MTRDPRSEFRTDPFGEASDQLRIGTQLVPDEFIDLRHISKAPPGFYRAKILNLECHSVRVPK